MITLHEAFVPTALQLLGSVDGLLKKAESHCAEHGKPAQALIGARLAPDMLDLAYQVKSCAGHSFGAIEGLRKGNFSPDIRLRTALRGCAIRSRQPSTGSAASVSKSLRICRTSR